MFRNVKLSQKQSVDEKQNKNSIFLNQIKKFLPDNFFDSQLSSSFRCGIVEQVLDDKLFKQLSTHHPAELKIFLLYSISDEDVKIKNKNFMKLLNLHNGQLFLAVPTLKNGTSLARLKGAYIAFRDDQDMKNAIERIDFLFGSGSCELCPFQENTIQINESLLNIFKLAGYNIDSPSQSPQLTKNNHEITNDKIGHTQHHFKVK